MRLIKKAPGKEGKDLIEEQGKDTVKISYTFKVSYFFLSLLRVEAIVENINFATLLMPMEDWQNIKVRKQIGDSIVELFFKKYGRGGRKNGK